MWQGSPPLTSCYNPPPDFDTLMDGTMWPGYGAAPADNVWDTSAGASPIFDSFGRQDGWPLSPLDQPLPSPLSEGSSYFFAPSPMAEDGLSARRASPAITSQASRLVASQPHSPATTASSTLSTPVPKPKEKAKTKPSHLSSLSKRPAEASPKPRPRTLKRYRSDTGSVASLSTERTSNTSRSTNTTLGGVLPANVDPRVASEQIRREAWERCKAEAWEMSQRRMMLLDHEQGALERETRKLQVNIGRMREAVARDKAEQEEAADRAGKWASRSDT